MMNPMQIMQLLQTTNNPMMLLEHFSGDPIMQRAMQMGQGKSEEQLKATAHNIEHKCDFYYAMNMLYSDLSTSVGTSADMYVKMAKALYFDDPDMVEGKLFRQWMAVAFVKKE